MKAPDWSSLPVAILCGGLGTRLGPLTATTPKSLVTVAGRPFLAWQLELLRRCGHHGPIVLCAGHLADQLRPYLSGNVLLSDEGQARLGTAGAIRKALPLLGPVFWVTYGDSYLEADRQPVFDAFMAKPQTWACISLWRGIDYGLNLFTQDAFKFSPEYRDLGDVAIHALMRGKLANAHMPAPFHEIGSPSGLAALEKHLLCQNIPSSS